MRYFNVAKIAGAYKVHGSEVDVMNSYGKMSGNVRWNRCVFSLCSRNEPGRRMTEYQEVGCSIGRMQKILRTPMDWRMIELRGGVKGG